MPDLRSDLKTIYEGGLEAVSPSRVLQKKLHCSDEILFIDDKEYPLPTFRKIFIIGVGKASLAMSQTVLDLSLIHI